MDGTSGVTCRPGQLGEDCGFNLDRSLQVVFSMWCLTSAGLAAAAVYRTSSGRFRRSLLLASASAFVCGLDVALYIMKAPGAYAYGTLSFVGSVLLVHALRLFIRLFADIIDARGALPVGSIEDKESAIAAAAFASRVTKALRFIRIAYDCMALAHAPFALTMAVAAYDWGPSYQGAMWAWMVWCFISACVGTSLVSVLLWHVTASSFQSVAAPDQDPAAVETQQQLQEGKAMRTVSFTHLSMQVVGDMLLLFMAILYLSPKYDAMGWVQGAVILLGVSLLWLMHAQLLAFASKSSLEDPLWSAEEETPEVQSSAAGKGVEQGKVVQAPALVQVPSLAPTLEV